MSTRNQQEEVSKGSKDDDTNPVDVPSSSIEDNGCGDSTMEVQNTVLADMSKQSPEDSHVSQVELHNPSKEDSEPKAVDSSVVMEDITVQGENTLGKEAADAYLDKPSITAALEEPLDSPLTPPKPAEQTSLHDVSESEFELKWSDGEDEDATSLNDEALKKLDEELGIDDKTNENVDKASQFTVPDLLEKPMELEILKKGDDYNETEKNLEVTVDKELLMNTDIPEPSCPTKTSDLVGSTKVDLEPGTLGGEPKPIQICEQESKSLHLSEVFESVCEPSSTKDDNIKFNPSQIIVSESSLIEEQQPIKMKKSEVSDLIAADNTNKKEEHFENSDNDTIKPNDIETSACDMETEPSSENVEEEAILTSSDSNIITKNIDVEISKTESTTLKGKLPKISAPKVSMEITDGDIGIIASSTQQDNTNIDDDKLEVTNDSIKINTEHRINRPDVMLDIPTQEFDIDDFEDTFEKEEVTDKPDKEDCDLITKTVTEIVNELSKESKDCTSIIKPTDNELNAKTSNENKSLEQIEIISPEDTEMTPVENIIENAETNLKDTKVSENSEQESNKKKEQCSTEVSEESNKDVMNVDEAVIETENQENDKEIKNQIGETSVSNVPEEADESVSEIVQKQDTNIVEEKEETSVEASPVSATTDHSKPAPEKEDENAEISLKDTQKEATDVKPSTSKADQPSTSSSELAISDKDKPDSAEPTKSSDVVEDAEVAQDSLGLLAESSRVLDEEEDEPEPEEDADDGDGDDDDEDFDPECEESSNQTGEHSEESNPPHSEVDIQEEGIDIEFNNEADKIELEGADTAFDSLLGESSDVPEAVAETPPASTEGSQDVPPPAAEPPRAASKQAARRGSLLADLLTKPRADMYLPEGAVRMDPSDTSVVDLEASSSDDDSQSKRDRRQTITLVQIAKQVEDATQLAAGTDTPKDNKPKTSEVLNLDSDDDDKHDKKAASFTKRAAEGNHCINYDCASDDTVPYYLADRMTIAYYGAARRRRRPVCQNCLNVVETRNEGLVAGIKDLRPLLALRMSRPAHTLLEISDSDSEGEDDPVGPQQAEYLENELSDMLNDVWSKYNMDQRLKETEDFLEAELDKMQKQSEEVDRLLRECQSATDAVRSQLYAAFEGPRKERAALVIHDTPIASYSCLETEEPPAINEPSRYSKRVSSTSLESVDVPAKKAALTGADDKRTTRSMYDAQPRHDDDRDVSVVRLSAEAAPADLPPAGEPCKPPLRPGVHVYAMKNQYGAWLKGRVTDVQPKAEHQYTMCRVRFEHRMKNPCKQLSARSLAYTEPSNVRMTIGTRVIALFKNSENTNKRGEFYYSGVVAEIPNPVNRYRYLVFFDDGYAQYVEHKHTRLVYESKALVWEEVHPFSRDFVCNYLMKYPERPMVRLHARQAVTVEWNGKWWETEVLSVDAALVQVRFPDARTEWIYRGSTRLQPLFCELQAARRTDRARLPRSTKPAKSNVPYVEYTRSDDQVKPDNSGEDLRRQRSVAKKSTSIAQQITSAATDGVISRVVFYTPKNSVRPLKMAPHKCGPHCKRTDLIPLAELQTYNPLTKPLLSGWERQIVKYKHCKSVMYRAPCGRRLRSLPELHAYLRLVHSDMAVDLFDYSPATHCLAEFVLSKTNVQKKDLSHGKEHMPVPCVNYYDHSLPEFCSYNTERTPTAGVPLNLDPDFLCGCDCTDDCVDKTKCACWKMTLEGARTIGFEGTDVGYSYRRLPEPLPSGIYECNSRCKCKSTCLNRVVQNPLQLKLQVFKTLNRGWGIRALNDVPKGSFICIYAGNLLTDATANLDGLNEGDEYLAELDYIEVVEAMKEGYEEDVPDADQLAGKKESKKSSSEPSSSETESEEESKDEAEQDGDFRPGYMSLGLTEFNKRLRRRDKKGKEEKSKQTDDKAAKKEDDDCITISDDEEVRTSLREPSRFAAEETMTDNKVTSKYRSIRSYFGKDEACYIMDAKVQGNIGRYLNHSCSPNVFVQNVFVDTHDPRFPWVSFFALHHIRAGTELTWNYNYDIGSVPGKVLYCYCGAPNCRGRLL